MTVLRCFGLSVMQYFGEVAELGTGGGGGLMTENEGQMIEVGY
jgi:hypothetical protein